MKKFSSFGRLLNQYPAIFTQNNMQNSNLDIDDCLQENKDNEQNLSVQSNQDAEKNDNINTANPDYFHYPQSDYDTLTQSKTQNNQNKQNDLQKDNDNASNQSQQEKAELSQKAKSLLACMKQHDNIVRKMQK